MDQTNNQNLTQCKSCRREIQCVIEEKIVNPQLDNKTYQLYFKCPLCGNENYLWREDDQLKLLFKHKADELHKFYTGKDKTLQYNHVLECRSLNNQIIARRKLLNKF